LALPADARKVIGGDAGGARGRPVRASDEKMRTALLFIALALFPIAFLWSVPAVENNCLHTLNLGAGAHFEYICDTNSIIVAADRPDVYLTTSTPWRMRPAYIATAALIAGGVLPILKVTDVLGSQASPAQVRGLAAGVALLIIDWLVFGAAMWFALRIGGWPFAMVVASCDLVHGFIWSMHPAEFNLIIALGAIWFYMQGAAGRYAVRCAVLLGFVLCCYQSAAIWWAMYAAGSWMGRGARA